MIKAHVNEQNVLHFRYLLAVQLTMSLSLSILNFLNLFYNQLKIVNNIKTSKIKMTVWLKTGYFCLHNLMTDN